MNPDQEQPNTPQENPELDAQLVQADQHNKEVNGNLNITIAFHRCGIPLQTYEHIESR